MAYERDWRQSINNWYICSSALDYTRYQLWSLKGLLTGVLGGLTLGLWTVDSSCGAVSHAVTFQDTGDTVTLTAHGYVNGQSVSFSVITSTTGIATSTNYFIVNKTADTFQLSATAGGAALPLTTNGTGTLSQVSSGAAGDLLDYWGTTYDGTKIVRGTNTSQPHSWVVLKSPTSLTPLGIPFYLLITFDGGVDAACTFYVAKTPFSGGTAQLNPTSVDAWILQAVQTSINTSTAAGSNVAANFLLSTTGDFIWLTTRPGANTGYWPETAVAVVNPVGCHALDAFPLWTYKWHATSGAFDSGHVSPTAPFSSMPARRADGYGASIGQGISFVSLPTEQGLSDMLTGKRYYTVAQVLVGAGAANGSWHMRGRLPDIYYVPPGVASVYIQGGSILRDISGNIAQVFMGALALPFTSVPVM